MKKYILSIFSCLIAIYAIAQPSPDVNWGVISTTQNSTRTTGQVSLSGARTYYVVTFDLSVTTRVVFTVTGNGSNHSGTVYQGGGQSMVYHSLGTDPKNVEIVLPAGRHTFLGDSPTNGNNIVLTANFILQLSSLRPGSISGSQTILSGQRPATITSTSAAWVYSGTITYQWQSSTNNSTWTNISGATSLNYSPPTLTATTYYRRQARSGAEIVYSNVVTIKTPSAGTIRLEGPPNILSGTIPGLLGSSAPAQGVGTLTYQWQKSTNDGSTWSNISGATAPPSQSPAISVSTQFRRMATVSGQSPLYSNVVSVTIINPGTISGDHTIMQGTTPYTLTTTSGASGYVGTVSYQWMSSTNNSTWTTISGATSESYQPGPLTATTYFRRMLIHSGPYAYSNTVTITVIPDPRLPFAQVSGVVTSGDVSTKTRGLKYYEKVAVLDGSSVSSSPTYVERSFYYDYKGRVIQTVERNHLGGVSRYSTQYDFVDNITKSHESHQSSPTASTDTRLTTFVYDHRGRLKSETTTVNNGTPATVTYAYDELGQLTGKTYGTGANALTETLTYNIQGWLTEQNSTLFNMKLRYYDPVKTATAKSYTGNISEWEWQHKGTGGGSVNTYAFTYDKLSRLKNTTRYVGNTQNNAFTERDISYDRNGNFLTLKRYGATTTAFLDNIVIPESNYRGNQIISATNNGTTYTYDYDNNGNMTVDDLNALKLEYNFLNLTSVVKNTSNVVQAQYRWLADGSKAGVRNGATGSSGLEYLGSLVYKRDNTGLKLESTGFGGGRIEVSQGSGGTVYTPNYYIADHLGSTRVIWNGSSTVPRSDFTPFGTRWTSGSAAASRYQFSGYEDQPLLADKYMDAGARFRGKVLPVWNRMDDKLEDYFPWSPYNYTLSNPVNAIDPDGRSSITLTGAAAQAAFAQLQQMMSDGPDEDEWRQRQVEQEMVERLWSVNPIKSGNPVRVPGGVVDMSAGEGYATGEIDPIIVYGRKGEQLQPGYKGYTYNDGDWAVRNFFINNGSRLMRQALSNLEAKGYMSPLTKTNFFKLYGETTGNLIVFRDFLSLMLDITPGHSPIGNVKGFNFNYNIQSNRSTSILKSPNFNEFNAFRSNNIGQFRGIPGRGNSTKVAWDAYLKHYGY